MNSLSFVIVQPGTRATAATKHEQRVGIHSHAQKVTQQRKRKRRMQEAEIVKRAHSLVARNAKLSKGVVHQRSDGQGEMKAFLVATHHNRFQYGLPTPSPEPGFDRPLTDHSSWVEDHRYGVSMFLHLTVLDINEVATNMNFWKYVVPAYSECWTCVRDIVSAIASANQAIQTRDNDLILVALRLHLHAIGSLRRDLMSLPLSAQVTCCLLFDAFNVLRCDFVQAGTQIAIARQLTSSVQLDAYFKDENLATVCDALNRMSLSSAWSLWNPSYFLRYEGLRHAEPDLHIDLQPIDEQEGILKGLVQSMERLSRHFSGRIRRNLSETAWVDPSSPLARDPTERATVQQAELAWNFTWITFTAGVLHTDNSIYDNPIYLPYYNRIIDVAQQRFTEATTHNSNANSKAFLHVIIPSLWLIVLMCRIPMVRDRCIQTLKAHNHHEGDFDSLVTGRMAEVILELEVQNKAIDAAWQIPLHDRIQIEGIKYVAEQEEVVLSYSKVTTDKAMPAMLQKRIPWSLEGDSVKFSNAILALSQSCTLYRKVRSSAAPSGCIKPMYYNGNLVAHFVK